MKIMPVILALTVLPLTREWIEISPQQKASYLRPFSLLRGSGLKFLVFSLKIGQIFVLPLTREWIEILTTTSLRGFGTSVLPLTREWIEIQRFIVASTYRGGSPSYEGVD